MVKRKRQAIYDWLVEHKGDYGAVYKGKPIEVSQMDFDRIRIRIANGYKYAELQHERITDNKVKILVRIKDFVKDEQPTAEND